MACGTVVYYMLTYISDNATTISSMGADEATAKLRMVIDSVLGNRAMMSSSSAIRAGRRWVLIRFTVLDTAGILILGTAFT